MKLSLIIFNLHSSIFKLFRERASFGFTLIEILIVIGIIGIVATSTVAIFTRFNQQQAITIASKNIRNDLAEAKSYALSHVVINCETGILVGYRLRNLSNRTYTLQEICDLPPPGGTPDYLNVRFSAKELPPNVVFDGNFTIDFNILQGGATVGSVRLRNESGGDETISITAEGVIQ